MNKWINNFNYRKRKEQSVLEWSPFSFSFSRSSLSWMTHFVRTSDVSPSSALASFSSSGFINGTSSKWSFDPPTALVAVSRILDAAEIHNMTSLTCLIDSYIYRSYSTLIVFKAGLIMCFTQNSRGTLEWLNCLANWWRMIQMSHVHSKLLIDEYRKWKFLICTDWNWANGTRR